MTELEQNWFQKLNNVINRKAIINTVFSASILALLTALLSSVTAMKSDHETTKINSKDIIQLKASTSLNTTSASINRQDVEITKSKVEDLNSRFSRIEHVLDEILLNTRKAVDQTKN